MKEFEDCNEIFCGQIERTRQVQSACFNACPIEMSQKSTNGIDLIVIVLSSC